MSQYLDIYKRAGREPEAFWAETARSLHWYREWDNVLTYGSPTIPRWFAGGEINACYNCVDRHVEAGHGDDAALLYESPVTQTSRVMTYAELQDNTARMAGVLKKYGAVRGERVIIYMPNSCEAVIAMLACARIGAIHSVVFGGFAAKELAARIDDARPKLVLAASCGIEGAKILPYQPILREAYGHATYQPDVTIYWQRDQARADLSAAQDLDWAAEFAAAEAAPCVSVPATHPLYILYTSGTTGQPKGIVRDTGGYLAALSWTMEAIYDCPPGAAYWAASDVGWVVGHSYIVYGPLLNRNATVVFEGKPIGTPDAGIFWRTIEKHNVRSFFTAPTAIRAIKQIDPDGVFLADVDLGCLNAVFLAGERTDPDTLSWTQNVLGKPVVDHWWQTETGWGICANPLGIEALPPKPGSTCVPMPGWDVRCLDDSGQQVAAGETGALAAKLPLPPGAAPTLWDADERYREAYLAEHDGYYTSGDAGYIDEDGYVFVMTRTDDVINVAGHRLSSSAMEEVLAAHKDVAECAVVALADELKGHVPAGFVVLKSGTSAQSEELKQQLVQDVREAIGPVAAYKRTYIVDRLPKTRSGKILRRTIRQIADGDDFHVPATIEDRSVLNEYLTLFGRA